jgi:multidrug/hemolysin transport system permease protein
MIRNLRVFTRDRLTVFFAMLAPLIMFILFLLFFRQTTANVIMLYFQTATSADAYGACDAWLFASVVTLSTFTSSLGMLNGFVEDRAVGRFSDYLVAPLERWQLTVGYILSTLIVSFLISVGLLVLGQIWALFGGQALLPPGTLVRALLCIFLSALVFSSFNTLWVTFLPTPGAFAGYAIITGTAIGFVAFCYVPPQMLSPGLTNVLSCLPFAQAAALVRDPMTNPGLERLIDTVPYDDIREWAGPMVRDSLGISVEVGGHTLSNGLIVVILLALTAVFSLIGSWRMGKIIR